LGTAIASAMAVLLAGLGHRWGWWDHGTELFLVRCGAWTGAAATTISLFAVNIARRANLRRAKYIGTCGVIAGLLAFGLPAYQQTDGPAAPLIHDVTTDTNNPPRFVAVLPLRKDAPNISEYGGPDVAAEQKKGYPDLAPANLAMPPRAAFDLALGIARASGWEIVAAEPAEYRIEATATTLLLRFKDDVVIRITPTATGSRVDLRSVSRVGYGDLGANANRIRKFLKQLATGKTG
jgi:uncharacterized protein (DUF1499 family)